VVAVDAYVASTTALNNFVAQIALLQQMYIDTSLELPQNTSSSATVQVHTASAHGETARLRSPYSCLPAFSPHAAVSTQNCMGSEPGGVSYRSFRIFLSPLQVVGGSTSVSSSGSGRRQVLLRSLAAHAHKGILSSIAHHASLRPRLGTARTLPPACTAWAGLMRPCNWWLLLLPATTCHKKAQIHSCLMQNGRSC
jgi:hypothetical protein